MIPGAERGVRWSGPDDHDETVFIVIAVIGSADEGEM